MKIIFFLCLFFICDIGYTQCYELLDKRLKNTGDIPYLMVDKFYLEVQSGKVVTIKIKNVDYKQKLGFLFQSHKLGDTLDVSLLTLNRKVLAQKKITKDDDFLRYEPFRKSENYFLVIKTSVVVDTSNKKPFVGCLGLAVLERVKRKALKKVQKIEWVVE